MKGHCSGQPRNWSYVWIWNSFRSNHQWYVSTAIQLDNGSHVFGVGARNMQETVSRAADTVTVATRAWATVEIYSVSGAALGEVSGTTERIR